MKPKSPSPSQVRERAGASQSKVGLKDRWLAYLAHHQITAAESLERLLLTPLQSLLTWLVVAIALALPASLFVAMDNMAQLGQGWQSQSQLSVFLHPRARVQAIETLRADILAQVDIESVEWISAERALEEFQQHSGLGDVLQSLDSNPLPPLLLVQPHIHVGPERLAVLQQELSAEAIVEQVSIDMQWLQRLYQLLELGQCLVLALAGLLGAGVLLVIGNTIRLAIENRRDEIVIVKLVGGTDAFVRRPFLYTGIWYGLGGGLLALVLLGLALWWLSAPVAQLADLYQSDFRLQSLSLSASVLLVVGAGLLGWLGAWLAVGRHLGAIEPK